MKTITHVFLLCFLSNLSFGQFNNSEPTPKGDKNSLTLDYNSRYGIGIKYDRVIFQKGKYALVGQVGAANNPFLRFGNKLSNQLEIKSALYNRFTFDEHSVEVGAGISVNKVFLNKEIFVSPRNFTWNADPYLHLGYMYKPKGKNWFLRANLNVLHSKRYGLYKNMSFGTGFKF